MGDDGNGNDPDGEEKSRLLEDLLMSDGELSGTEESEDEGDNPFAASDSDGSDEGDAQSSSKSKKRRPAHGGSSQTTDEANDHDSDDADDMLSVQEDSDVSED